jgi:hypothetical protein
MSAVTRFAVYWAPERDDLLWTAGCEWLGRDPERRVVADTLRPGTDEPRRYGFHATLKAPMHLTDAADEPALFGTVGQLAARTARFAMPVLEVATLRGFVALRPTQPLASDHPLRRLADACVTELDGLRREPTTAESQRRTQAQTLGSHEAALLQRWGYPHVFDQWQFHMTLSDNMPDLQARQRLHIEAQRHFAPALIGPVVCESISVFVEPAPGASFVLARRFALAR